MEKQPQLDPELSMTLKYILENPELLNAPEKVLQENGTDEKSKEKKLEGDMSDLSSAYLGPQLWDTTGMLLCDDLKMEPVEMNDILCQNDQSTDSDVSDLAMLIQSANYSPGSNPHPQSYPGQGMYTKNGSTADSQKEKEEKQKQLEDEMPDLQSAFLGPQLWNNMLMSDDLKLEPVEMNDMLDDSICASNDLAMLMRSAQYSPSSSHSDEMRNIPQSEVPATQLLHQPMNGQVSLKPSNTSPLLYNGNYPNNTQYTSMPTSQAAPQLLTSSIPSITVTRTQENNLQNADNGLELSPVRIPSPSNCDFQPSEADLLIATPKPEGGDLPKSQIYNPKTRKFMDDELKPQPIIRKAKKLYVNDENKDNKYWARREKNNAAAKRSREARRVKENQIALRASFLEKENQAMKQEITSLRAELAKLVKVVKKYEEGF